MTAQKKTTLTTGRRKSSEKPAPPAPERRYRIELSEKQLFLLEQTCENYARMLAGQDMIFKDLFEEAWHRNVQEKQHLEYSGPEFWEMRHQVEEHVNALKTLCWNQPLNSQYGVKYSDKSDILFDMYQTFRYRRWQDMSPEDHEFMRNTVMSNTPGHYGSESLPVVEVIDQDSTG